MTIAHFVVVIIEVSNFKILGAKGIVHSKLLLHSTLLVTAESIQTLGKFSKPLWRFRDGMNAHGMAGVVVLWLRECLEERLQLIFWLKTFD